MIRFILYALLVVFAIRALSRLMRGVLQGAGYTQDPSKPSVNLKRDPVCGMFVVPSQALMARRGTETQYFCSEKCRREWKG